MFADSTEAVVTSHFVFDGHNFYIAKLTNLYIAKNIYIYLQ